MKWNRVAFAEQMAQRFGRERWNEHVKLLATALNGVSIACLIGGFVAPLINPVPPKLAVIPMLFVASFIMHVAAHEVLRYYRGKE